MKLRRIALGVLVAPLAPVLIAAALLNLSSPWDSFDLPWECLLFYTVGLAVTAILVVILYRLDRLSVWFVLTAGAVSGALVPFVVTLYFFLTKMTLKVVLDDFSALMKVWSLLYFLGATGGLFAAVLFSLAAGAPIRQAKKKTF